MKKRALYLALIPVGLLLAACAAAGPRLVGFAPAPTPIGVYPSYPETFPPDGIYLELAVDDFDAALREVSSSTYRYNARTVPWRTWQEAGGRRWSQAAFDLPAGNAASFRFALKDLGQVVRESEWSCAGGCGGAVPLTLLVTEKASWPVQNITGPANTLQKAWGVSRAIFGFLLDILIWLAVVGGPIVFLGWGAWMVYRRWKARKA